MEEIFGVVLRDDYKTKPVLQFGAFLALMGLSLSRRRKKMTRGVVSYQYSLDPDRTKETTELASRFKPLDYFSHKNLDN